MWKCSNTHQKSVKPPPPTYEHEQQPGQINLCEYALYYMCSINEEKSLNISPPSYVLQVFVLYAPSLTLNNTANTLCVMLNENSLTNNNKIVIKTINFTSHFQIQFKFGEGFLLFVVFLGFLLFKAPSVSHDFLYSFYLLFQYLIPFYIFIMYLKYRHLSVWLFLNVLKK